MCVELRFDRTFTAVDVRQHGRCPADHFNPRHRSPVIETVFDEVASLSATKFGAPVPRRARQLLAVSWEMTDTVGTPSSGAYQLNVTHTAVDACGNAASTPKQWCLRHHAPDFGRCSQT